MIKVYIAQHGYEYEPQSLVGVFTSLEKAKEACNNSKWPEQDPLQWKENEQGNYWDTTNNVRGFYMITSVNLDECQLCG